MKIEEALEKYLVQLEANGRSPSTIAQYERHVRLFAHWIADVGHCGDLNQILNEDIARFLTAPVARTRPDGRPKKATSMNILRSSIRGFFQYLHEAGTISQNPARLVRRAICETPPPRILTDAEAGKLMKVLAEADGFEARRDHALFHLMLATGIRLGSAIALDTDDVDLDTGRLHLRTCKRDREAVVYLGREICAHLAGYLEDLEPGALFTTRAGRRLSRRHVQRRFGWWVKAAGIRRPASLHALRHSFATSLYHRTGDIFLVQRALNHRSVMSTMRYARASDDRVRDAIQAIQ